MGVLDVDDYRERGRDSFGVKLGPPIVTNGDVVVWKFVNRSSCCLGR